MSQFNTPNTELLEREAELQTINTVLHKFEQTDVNEPQLIFVLGSEGSGRTSLLQAAINQAGATFRVINLPAKDTNPAILYLALSPAPDSPNYPYFEKYRQTVTQSEELMQRVERAQLALGLPDLAAANPFEERLRTVQALPPAALHYLIRRIYTTYNPAQLSEMAVAFLKTGLEHLIQLNANNLNQLRAFVSDLQASMTTEEWEVYLRPESSLARAFGEGLAQIAAEKPLLVVLDDYSVAEERFLPRIIDAAGKRVSWLFAATQVSAWAERLHNVTTIELTPLSAEAIASFFQTKVGLALSPKELKWFEEISKGWPLAVQLLTALLAAGASPVDIETAILRTPDKPLEGLFLYLLEESGKLAPTEIQRFYTLAVLRDPDADFMAEFEKQSDKADFPFDKDLTQKLLETYPWAFADKNIVSGYLPLHPTLQAVLLRYLLVERRRFAPPVQEVIVEPARNTALKRLNQREDELVAEPSEQGSLRARTRDAKWGRYVADTAYYRLWLDEAVGFLFLVPRLVFATVYNPALAHQLLAAIEPLTPTFHVEGAEFVPVIRTLLADSFAAGTAKTHLEDKLKALDVLDSLGTSERGRWYKAENLGKRPGGKGSNEAEVRGLIRWMQGRAYEEAGQYDRAISTYEGVLATNVEMPELKQATGRAALYLATRSRLRGAHESALSGFLRAVELEPGHEIAYTLLLWQAIRLNRPDAVLKAASGLDDLHIPAAGLYSTWALWAMGRLPEALTEARTYAARAASTNDAATFQRLIELAGMEEPLPEGVEQILVALNSAEK